MSLLLNLYNKTLNLASHQYAPRYLALISFVESSFFPIPPDVILTPMLLAQPKQSFRFAAIATGSSVVGGLFGYILGYFAFSSIVEPFIAIFGYEAVYSQAMVWFTRWGLLMILLAGFTPIPYKLFTISAGVLHYSIPLFILGSVIGRAARFFLLAALVMLGGEKLEVWIKSLVTKLGWLMLALVSIIIILIKL